MISGNRRWECMRTKILLDILSECTKPVSKPILAEKMNLSESSIRNIVRESNTIGGKNGFQIDLVRGQGYLLQVTCEDLFKRYEKSVESLGRDVYNPEQRVNMIVAYLLQAENFTTIDQLADSLQVSRNTIVKDLEWVKEVLENNFLQLEKRAHYGIRISGDESDYRRAFSKYVLSDYYLAPTQEFKDFITLFNLDELRELLTEAIVVNELTINNIALENVVRHIRILIFRSLKKNFITPNQHLRVKPDEAYYKVSKSIAAWINTKYQIELPESEVSFLGAHISGKTYVGNIDWKEKKLAFKKLSTILIQLDNEFSTIFSIDEVLRDDLLFHMLPLLKRLYYNLQLENPLVEEIYSKYANVFVIAYRFAELIEQEYGYKMSRDEAGYVALHFAANLERVKNLSLEKYKRIVVICTTGGGSAEILRLKLESVFSKALIATAAVNEIQKYQKELPDLFLSTVPTEGMETSFSGVPIIHIKQWLDDDEIRRIKEIVSFHIKHENNKTSIPSLKELFKEELFYKESEQRNYLELLRNRSEDLVNKGFAVEGFPESVMERENKFTTIYQHGIAGPHAMKLEALEDCVSITVMEEPMEWQGKNVQFIFLINLKSGHLFLHKELSRLLLRLMENSSLRNRLVQAKNYRQFIIELEMLM